jgi:hypothetical protein
MRTGNFVIECRIGPKYKTPFVFIKHNDGVSPDNVTELLDMKELDELIDVLEICRLECREAT